jgi:hypothetical protein
MEVTLPWILGLVIVLLSVVLGSACLVKISWSKKVLVRYGSCLLLVALLHVAGTLIVSDGQTGLPWLPNVVQLIVIVLGGLAVAHVLGPSALARPSLVPAVLLLISVLCLGLIAWNVDQHDRDDDLAFAAPNAARSRLVASTEANARTDHGSPVQLFVRVLETPPEPSVEDALAQRLARRVIEVGPVTYNYNCHGWTFAGGQYVILGEEVGMILRDNGYDKVAKPQAGDVIVYYQELDDSVVHTGVVRAVSPDGLVLVESKWGDAGARYLHEPSVQPYSMKFAYYRSSRGSHLLAGLQTPKGKATLVASENSFPEDEAVLCCDDGAGTAQ